MATNKIDILLGVDDKATGKLNRFTQSTRKNWLAITAAVAGTAIAVKKLSDTIVKVNKEVISANAKFERWSVQMRAFTRDGKEANKVLDDLIQFSVKTPFTPEAVIEAGKLLKPLEELGINMQDALTAAGNASAAFNISMQESALQLVRSFTAGIGAADLFRDRGVRSFIEVKTGVDLTKLSLEELREVLTRELTTGELGNSIERLSQTFEGLMSTLSGELFLFKKEIGEGVFDIVKDDLKAILVFIKESKEEGGKYKEVVDSLSDSFVQLFDAATEFFLKTAVFSANVADAFREVGFYLENARVVWLLFLSSVLQGAEKIASIKGLKIFGIGEETAGDLEAALDEIEQDIFDSQERIRESRDRANEDLSVQMEEQIQIIRDALAKIKEDRIKAESDTTEILTEEGKKQVEQRKKTEAAKQELAKETIAFLEEGAKVSKEIAIALKVVRSAEALIDTYRAASRALAEHPAPYSFAIAALVTAKGLAQVAAINDVALAEGGIVTRPTRALIGEAGPEAVIPLNNSFGFGDVNIYIQGGINPGGSSIDEMAEQLGFAFEREVRTARGI